MTYFETKGYFFWQEYLLFFFDKMARISSPMIDRAPCARALEGVSTVSTGTKWHKKLDMVQVQQATMMCAPEVGAFVYLFCNRTNLFILIYPYDVGRVDASGLAWHLSGEPDAGQIA